MMQKKIKILNLLHLRSKKEMSEALNELNSLNSKLDEIIELNGALAIQLKYYGDLREINEVAQLRSQAKLASTIYSEMQKVKAQKDLLEEAAATLRAQVLKIDLKRKNILSRIDKVKLEMDK